MQINICLILILSVMKRIIWVFVLSASMTFVYGQKSIDALFNKYAGKDGFVTVTLKGDLLKLIRSKDDDNDKDCWPGHITEIRILAQEDEEMKVENFYDLVVKDINVRDYEEFMSVRNSDQDLKMLVRTEGKTISEFLLIGGGEDNLIIQIKGKMTFEEAEDFSSEVKKEHGAKMLSDLN